MSIDAVKVKLQVRVGTRLLFLNPHSTVFHVERASHMSSFPPP